MSFDVIYAMEVCKSSSPQGEHVSCTQIHSTELITEEHSLSLFYLSLLYYWLGYYVLFILYGG